MDGYLKRDLIEIIFRNAAGVEGDFIQRNGIIPSFVDGCDFSLIAVVFPQIQHAPDTVKRMERFKFILIRLTGTVKIFADLVKVFRIIRIG